MKELYIFMQESSRAISILHDIGTTYFANQLYSIKGEALSISEKLYMKKYAPPEVLRKSDNMSDLERYKMLLMFIIGL
jgi:hypothetical protein